jgi:AcrR family transcriptional regulator
MKRGDFQREYRRGASLYRLSLASGRSRSYIRRQLELANVRLREPPRFPSDPDWWRGQVERGLTPKAIAAKLGCSETTVYRYLRSTRPAPPTFEEWLAARSRPAGDCLRWLGAHSPLGYAVNVHGGRTPLVHRLVWEQYHGPIPGGAVIAHRCPHRDCVELAHLYLSSRKRRAADTTAAGRMAHGEAHWNHILTWDAVRRIRAGQEPTSVLAARYHVAPATISSVRAWRRWRNPPDPAQGSTSIGMARRQDRRR